MNSQPMLDREQIIQDSYTPPPDVDATRPWSLRRRIVGRILKFFFGRPQEQPKLKPEELRRVLLIRHDRLGDYIITTPILETLKRYAPQAEIDVLGSKFNAGVIGSDPRVSKLILWSDSFAERIKAVRLCRTRDYDATFQLVTRHTTLPIIIAGLTTPRGRVVGRGHRYNRWLFDHRLTAFPSKHLAEQTFAIFTHGVDFGEEVPTMPPYSLLLDEKLERETERELEEMGLRKGEFILLNLSASEEYRTLRTERAIELAQMLNQKFGNSGLKIAVTGAPNEKEKIEEVARKGNATVMSFPSILKASAAIRRARLLISPDTGSVHIASAVGTPVVAYYTEFLKPAMWRPLEVPHKVVIGEVNDESDSISLEEIVQAVAEMLKIQE
ncbi:MAG: glycosyltransferase family 9 protein [Candidatus Kapaibacterium sp.]|nr:glycosyltransferase family 9 protein [Ignavibacteria bacterium]